MGGAMVIRNGGSKNSTSPPYLVKNERSLKRGSTVSFLNCLPYHLLNVSVSNFGC